MVITDADIGGPLVSLPKDDPPLVVNPNRMKSLKFASQGFEAVARRDGEVAQPAGIVELDQLAQGDTGDGGEATVALFVEELPGIGIAEGLNHRGNEKGRGDLRHRRPGKERIWDLVLWQARVRWIAA